jgi:hypothetical protein
VSLHRKRWCTLFMCCMCMLQAAMQHQGSTVQQMKALLAVKQRHSMCTCHTHLEVVAAQDDGDNVLANVVHVTLHMAWRAWRFLADPCSDMLPGSCSSTVFTCCLGHPTEHFA